MLTANKSPIIEKTFSIYNRNLLRRKFNTLRIKGLDSLTRDQQSDHSLIFSLNHSSWWDGLVAYQISRALPYDSYFMMEEKQLAQYRLFLKLGAFSIVRENAREALKSLKYAEELLATRGRAVWMFPQGEILPNNQRPLRFYKGIERLASATMSEICIVTLRYEFLAESKPDILANVAQTKELQRPYLVDELSAKTEELLEGMTQDIDSQNLEDYKNLI